MIVPNLIDADDSILFVIDLQDAFLAKLDPARRESVVDACRFLVEAACRLAVPVLVTVEEPVENGATAAPVRACLPADVPERDKRVFGLCDQDDIRDAVLAQPRRTAVLVGLETDVCILHSAVGLRQNGFRVVVVSDATGAPGDEHELGLERAAAFGAEFVHAKGLYYEWVRSLEGLRRAKTPHPIRPPLGSGL